MQVVLAVESKEVYDINDRQTKDLKKYIDTKVNAATESAKEFTDSLFVTFDGKMRELTKNFVIQMAIILIFATVLGNLIVMLLKNKHEKKLLEYQFQIILSKSAELRHREIDILNQYNQAKKDIDKRVEEMQKMERGEKEPAPIQTDFSVEVNIPEEQPAPTTMEKEMQEKKSLEEELPVPPAPTTEPPVTPEKVVKDQKGLIKRLKGKMKRKPKEKKEKAPKPGKDLERALKGVK